MKHTIKGILLPIARAAEAVFDRIFPGGKGQPLLEPYIGYATPDRLILRARVLTRLRHSAPAADQSKWANFKQMLSLFLTDEVRDVNVSLPEYGEEAASDEEGYVILDIPRPDEARAGWLELMADIEDGQGAALPVYIPPSDAPFGVISDVDDTMIRTRAYSLARNLWTTFTGSALSRHVFPDSIALMKRLTEDTSAPVFYVSSSPWNLHQFLERLFDRAGLVRGPMFLRDLGIGENQLISGTHGDHKGRAIDTILAANPDLRFVLIGDTGQHDAHVYHDAIKRHTGRIAAAVLRQPGPGPDADSLATMAEIEAAGTPLFSAPSFASFADEVYAAASKV